MDGESSSLNTDYISKQSFLSMGSNTGQTGVTIVQQVRYASAVNKWVWNIRYMFQFTLKRRELKLFISILFFHHSKYQEVSIQLVSKISEIGQC